MEARQTPWFDAWVDTADKPRGQRTVRRRRPSGGRRSFAMPTPIAGRSIAIGVNGTGDALVSNPVTVTINP